MGLNEGQGQDVQIDMHVVDPNSTRGNIVEIS